MTIGRIPSVEGGIQPTIVDAKGDLIAGVAADSVNRLAVGSNDQVLVADSAASTGMAWKSVATPFAAGKNKIINGDFAINQRGFTSTTTTAVYGFDRWRTSFFDGTSTFSAETFTAGTAPVAGYEAINFARLVSTGQTSTSSQTSFAQRIEDVRTFAGQTVTLSFWAKASTGTPNVSVEVGQNFGSGGSATVTGSVATGTVKKIAITSSWVRYSASLTIPSISGKTIGTSSYFFVNLFTSAGSTLDTRTDSLGIQSVTIDFWGIQLEAGSVATAFQTATGTLQGELALAQRYYWRIGNQTGANTNSAAGWGVAYSTTKTETVVTYPVVMRVTPTSLDVSNMRISDGVAAPTVSAITIGSNSSTTAAVLDCTSTGLTQYRPYYLLGNTGYLGFNSEL